MAAEKTSEKTKTLEREYVIPLRRFWLIVPEYRRAARAAKTIKQFIAKHMKIQDRDLDKVKLDISLNHEIWFRGARHPPAKIKVKAVKEGDIVKVSLVEVHEKLKFMRAKHERKHKVAEKKDEKAPEIAKKDEAKEEKSSEQKVDEVEKEKAGEELQMKEAKQEEHTKKHTVKDKKVEIHRRAMNRH